MSIVAIRLKGREIAPHKAVISPLLTSRTVLTNSPWTFVALWLKRNRKPRALFYWEQAEEFHRASVGLPLRSAPLLLYYCFMNATKALLAAKGVSFDERHGVSAYPKVVTGGKRTFAGEGIKIHTNGILPSLSTYYGETEASSTHTLQELLFNMVFVHRTYCLTYSSQKEMFLPLANSGYVYDTRTKEVFFKANIANNIPYLRAIKKLPAGFVAAPIIGPRAIRSVASLSWRRPGRPTATNVHDLIAFNRSMRQELHFINGAQALWYLRSRVAGPKLLDRQLPTLILAAIHRLSEICRYQPLQLESLLNGQKNWLLSEFIQMSADQFIDEIASEMTGFQFLVPNVRAPS
ncbi:YaaC family protein (plasmid) [Bradyrhizobium barranii subsp. barranii]|uniref:YaaC family protein n=1 Tax=Bradyrhizobium barranii subsp. barranii TaxID=2823807 RepID=A0A7Z0TST0_9BRAD|nr:YaaC family protein [Bradyrhizobium barranii]UGX89845.1 YaaC family protein [Bradyrhizobium barranii subsp. barranii]